MHTSPTTADDATPPKPTVTLNKDQKVAFNVSEKSLRRLHDILATLGITGVQATLSTSDGSTLNYKTLLGVQSFPNSRSRAITKLAITGRRPLSQHNDPVTSIDITLSNSREGFPAKNVFIIAQGDDGWILKLERDLREWLNECRVGWALAAELNIAFTATIVLMLLLLGISALVILLWDATSYHQPATNNGPKTEASYILLISGTLATYLTLDRSQKWLFPLGIFTTGEHGQSREEYRKWWRNFLGIVILAGVAVNLLAWWIVR
jgi:hypothetical protein